MTTHPASLHLDVTTSAELQSTPMPSSLFLGPTPLHASENRQHMADTRVTATSGSRLLLPSELGSAAMYKLMIGAVVPRPIAWVSTCNAQGEVNLAPMSFFQAVSPDPPTLMVSFTRKAGGGYKDSMRNIADTRQFVVNSVNEWNAEQMNDTSATFEYGVSEMEKAGLTAVASDMVRPPRVGESAVSFECEVTHIVELGDGSGAGNSSVVLGRILCMHVRESVLTPENHIRIEQYRPIGRLGQTAAQRTRSSALPWLTRCPPAHPVSTPLAVCAQRATGTRGCRARSSWYDRNKSISVDVSLRCVKPRERRRAAVALRQSCHHHLCTVGHCSWWRARLTIQTGWRRKPVRHLR